MKTASMISVLVLALFVTAACSSGKKSAPAASANGPQTLTGTLAGDQVAAGAETTGWALTTSTGEVMIDVDVAAVEAEANSLQGKRVDVSGTITTTNYTTRGPTPILVAQQIKLAK